MRIGFKTSPRGVSWSALNETWALAGTLDVFDAGWMNDHLNDMLEERGGLALEALTALATLVHHLPGKWVGHAVLSNTFRHPAVLAKAATVLDQATQGRFILGLGAGWHEGEHEMFGIELPAVRERVDRFESALRVLRALFSDEARQSPGVTLDDPFYPLIDALNEPPPVTPGGPPIYLGGQGPRGLRLAGRFADGWLLPGLNAGDPRYLGEKRDALMRELEAADRDPAQFSVAGQVTVRHDGDPAESIEQAQKLVEAGATELILGMDTEAGPDGLRRLATEVAAPLRDRLG